MDDLPAEGRPSWNNSRPHRRRNRHGRRRLELPLYDKPPPRPGRRIRLRLDGIRPRPGLPLRLVPVLRIRFNRVAGRDCACILPAASDQLPPPLPLRLPLQGCGKRGLHDEHPHFLDRHSHSRRRLLPPEPFGADPDHICHCPCRRHISGIWRSAIPARGEAVVARPRLLADGGPSFCPDIGTRKHFAVALRRFRGHLAHFGGILLPGAEILRSHGGGDCLGCRSLRACILHPHTGSRSCHGLFKLA